PMPADRIMATSFKLSPTARTSSMEKFNWRHTVSSAAALLTPLAFTSIFVGVELLTSSSPVSTSFFQMVLRTSSFSVSKPNFSHLWSCTLPGMAPPSQTRSAVAPQTRVLYCSPMRYIHSTNSEDNARLCHNFPDASHTSAPLLVTR